MLICRSGLTECTSRTWQRDDGKAESVLEGRLLDQAALAGVLNQLFELHLPVMAVDCLGGSNDE